MEKFAVYGSEANFTLEFFLFSFEGLKAIGEANKGGDRDSCIRIYADAFADAFLHGESAPKNDGAVTAEEREAAESGRRDGMATAAQTGELAPAVGKALLRKYGGSDAKAKQAIVDELLQRAGLHE